MVANNIILCWICWHNGRRQYVCPLLANWFYAEKHPNATCLHTIHFMPGHCLVRAAWVFGSIKQFQPKMPAKNVLYIFIWSIQTTPNVRNLLHAPRTRGSEHVFVCVIIVRISEVMFREYQVDVLLAIVDGFTCFWYCHYFVFITSIWHGVNRIA